MTEQEENSAARREQLQDAAWKLADEWHAGVRLHVDVADLERLCPGFTRAEYEQAIHNALIWAGK